MEFKEIVAVSKLPGLYHMHKQRADGLILKSLSDDKVFFAASRAHNFTPLDNITIYTDNDPIELIDVMLAIKEKKQTLPSAKAEASELKDFFAKIVPNYDKERVYNSDIQKIVKWYALLDGKNLIQKPAEAKAEETLSVEVETTVEETSATEAKPKAKTTRKKKSEE